MRILANENVPAQLVSELRRRGHDTSWVRESAPGISDDDVVALAIESARVILTLDKDYGHLVTRRAGASVGVIVLRLAPLTVLRMAQAVTEALDSRTDWKGHLSVVEPGRVRMIPLARGSGDE